METTLDIDISTAKPIAFAPAMVAAIRAGRKTQTRRPVKPQPPEGWTPAMMCDIHKMEKSGHFPLRNGEPIVIGWGAVNGDGDEAYRCPYGKAGDLLYVKERWRYEQVGGELGLRYQSDDTFIAAPSRVKHDAILLHLDGEPFSPWHVHLPKWAARTFLRIESVRVERVQSITEDDAQAEGFEADPAREKETWWQGYDSRFKDIDGNYSHTMKPGASPPEWMLEPRQMVHTPYRTHAFTRFAIAWDSHNRADAYAWAADPWVWVIGFSIINREVQHAS